MAGTVFVRHGDSAQEFAVEAEASIGRAPDNKIVLSDLAVSRHHASVRLDSGTWRIVDLGSAGGTRVGDAALDPRVPRVVKPGEVVAIGPFRIELTTGAVPSAGPTIIAGGAATIVAPSQAAASATQILIPRPRITITTTEGTREVELKGDRLTLGRDDTQGVNDIVVKVSQVSSRHLEFRRLAGGGYEVEDLGSTNGTTLSGQRIQRRMLSEGDRFDIAGTVQIAYSAEPELAGVPGAAGGGEDRTLDLTGKGTITIGRDESSDVRLTQPTVSKQHARIVTTPDGHGRAIEDLGSTNGTFVNGERVVPGTKRVLKPDDEIRVGLVKLVFSAEELQRFDGSHAVGLDAVGLNQHIGQGVNLLKNISFSILPNEFVAVVGTSGAGKSTLLGALSGLKPASEGAVLLNGQGLYQNYDAFRTAMGYVPQDDILHKELPVGRALEYAAELRLPDDTTAQERTERVRDVIKQLGLEERRDVAIGSLSGGQRKRVSIGAELLTEPGLFFLDEATSGLDPGIEAQLMRLLRGLADEGHTVVLITHATKNVMLCDQVVFLARGGYMAYYGPPDKALEHFGVQDFDGIYEKLESESTPEAWAQKAAKSAVFDEFVTKRLASHGITGGVETVPRATVAPPPVRRSSGIRQLRILSRRYFDIIRRDRVNFALLFILAPALGSMDFIAWKRGTLTFVNGDTGQALSMLFLASLIPFLVGALSNVREIVKEAPIYARERAVSLEIWPYLSSKIAIAFMFAFYHAAALLIVKLIVVDFPEAGRAQFFEFYGTLALAVMCGILWALVISALTNKEEQAMLIIIAVIVVQVVFSGGVVSLASLGPVGTIVGSATSTSWAFKALVASAGMSSHGCGGSFPSCHLPGFGAFTNDAQRNVSYESMTKNYGDVFNADVFVCWGAMVAIMIGLCVVLYFLQKRKDRL
jgi:ABC transport system ATP-binding/permease protein